MFEVWHCVQNKIERRSTMSYDPMDASFVEDIDTLAALKGFLGFMDVRRLYIYPPPREAPRRIYN